MKAKDIRSKLAKYYHKPSDTILLEVIRGKPRSKEGGVWIEAQVTDIEATTEAINFDRVTSDYGKYLDKWYAEGLITDRERVTGKNFLL